MPEIRTSGLMSGDGKRGGASASVLAPVLDSTTPVTQPFGNGCQIHSICQQSRPVAVAQRVKAHALR